MRGSDILWYCLEKRVSCVNFFLFCSFNEIFFMKTEIMNIHFFILILTFYFIKSQVYFVQMKCTYVYFKMNFHATFLKQFLIKHILSCFSGIREALQNICVMHTLQHQYEHVLTFWCNVTHLYISVICYV